MSPVFLVVDTNIVISALLKKSVTQEMILSRKLSLFSPDYISSEILEHKEELLNKSGLSEERFKIALSVVLSCIEVIPAEEYSRFRKEATDLSPDPDDWPFLALCLKLNIPLWSNDKKIKTQSRVRVFSTPQLVQEFDVS